MGNNCALISSSTSGTSSDFPLWAIPLIIVGALLCIATIVIIIVMRNRKRNAELESREPLSSGLTEAGLAAGVSYDNTADDVALEGAERDSPREGDGMIAAQTATLCESVIYIDHMDHG